MTDTHSEETRREDAPSDNVVDLNTREAQAAEQPAGRTITEFVREHPVLVVAGGLAAGLLAGALLHGGTRRRLLRGGAALAEAAAAGGMALTRQALELAESTRSDLRQRGEAISERAERFGGAASERIERIGGSARERVRSIVTPAEAAAARAGRAVTDKAAEIRTRLGR